MKKEKTPYPIPRNPIVLRLRSKPYHAYLASASSMHSDRDLINIPIFTKAMNPNKRPRYDTAEMETSTQASPFMPMFEAFRNELDEHHDRRERIIKASRDITALSKKM
jgi:hypothetical protein